MKRLNDEDLAAVSGGIHADIGGICGPNGSRIENCDNAGGITGSGGGGGGGGIGGGSGAAISNNISIDPSTVSADSEYGANIGGICGRNE